MKELLLYKNIYDAIKKGEIPPKPQEMEESEWIDYLKRTKVAGVIKHIRLNGNNDSNSQLEKEMRKEYFRIMMLDNYRKAVAKRIIQIQNENGIVPVILKGLYLQEYVYPKGEFRFSSDIDIYVRDDNDYKKSVEILEKLGYHKYVYQSDLWQKKFSKGITFLKGDSYLNYFGIDLHKELFFNSNDKRYFLNLPFQSEDLYEQVTYEGCQAKIMKRELALIYLIYHHFKIHSFLGFLQIYDLLLLKNDKKLDTEKIYEIAKKLDYYDETKTILDFCDDFIYGKELNNIDLVLKSSYNNNFFNKIKYVKGFLNKIIYFLCWFFPSCDYLRSINNNDDNCLKLRLNDIILKIRDIKRKLFGLLKMNYEKGEENERNSQD